jgi:hypothetical protein
MNINPLKATGEKDPNPKETLLEAVPETERWNPVPGSAGHKVPAAPSEDEDDEGRSDNETMVESGIADAEKDQVAQAAKAAAKTNL